jgi:hypothetical protein
MANLSQEELVGFLQELFDHYGRKLTPTGQSVYLKYLGNVTANDLLKIVEWTIATQKFLPTPVEMLQTIAPSVDEIWATLLKYSNELSGLRYDQFNFSCRLAEIREELPSEVNEFLQINNVSLLNLGYESQTQLKALKKAFTTHMDKTIGTHNQALPQSNSHRLTAEVN